jgi:hypothetical protein
MASRLRGFQFTSGDIPQRPDHKHSFRLTTVIIWKNYYQPGWHKALAIWVCYGVECGVITQDWDCDVWPEIIDVVTISELFGNQAFEFYTKHLAEYDMTWRGHGLSQI